jgi:pimeloyl-ACP methyl ester carboxylesterase
MQTRRFFFGIAASLALLGGCATQPSLDEAPPIVFVHGNGDTAALWQTTIWRFESNGWPRDRLYAIELPYPSARDDDTKDQAGKTSTTQHMAFLKSEVEKVRKATGASKVVLFSNSRGGYAVRNYIQNGGGDATVSHAILGGAPNHGVWAIKGFREFNEFSGTGPFLTGLNAPKNANGDEVTGPVKWMTIRSEQNDKFAQPDGVWIGAKGTATNVTFAGPELKGAANVVIPQIDHRETSFSPAAFAAAYIFLTGNAPAKSNITAESSITLSGNITGMGVDSLDPKSGSFANNLPLVGAALAIFETDTTSGARVGGPVYALKIGADGRWGPLTAKTGAAYEFEITAPGYAITHIYRSAFPRTSGVVNLRAERIAEADRQAGTIFTFSRPRGYFDAQRDKMNFDGQTPPPGVPSAGAGVSTSTIKLPQAADRPVKAEFNGERITGRTWNVASNHVVVLELTY